MSRTIPKRTLRGLAAVATLSLTLAACGAGESDDTSGAAGEDAQAASVEEAKAQVEEWSKEITEWPEVTEIAEPASLKGKKVTIVPLGDQIPVIHGVGEGEKQALEKLGATVNVCDGKFNPTSIADCLKTAGDQDVDYVITNFVDYDMVPAAIDALTKKGTKVLVGSMHRSDKAPDSENLAFFDATERVALLYEAMSTDAFAGQGEETQPLFLKLMDSSTTKDASDRMIKKFEELCPSCESSSVEFTTANLDKLSSTVSAALVSNPETNAIVVPVDTFVPPAIQGAKSANKIDQVKVYSSSSDLAGLQRVKDGSQASDLGTPVIFEGWKHVNALMQMASGEEVQPADDLVTRAFTPDNVGDLELDPKTYLTDDWFGTGYQEDFLAAWGVK
ncbi:sugar ABC transporter substrate-binding protein [Janibacter anophelis]|uniref:sugar ABC transporter substrate-binding protein n=1 Tax=Janibacter anophelis TaxID=319054 RepID=UPI003F7F748F